MRSHGSSHVPHIRDMCIIFCSSHVTYFSMPVCSSGWFLGMYSESHRAIRRTQNFLRFLAQNLVQREKSRKENERDAEGAFDLRCSSFSARDSFAMVFRGKGKEHRDSELERLDKESSKTTFHRTQRDEYLKKRKTSLCSWEKWQYLCELWKLNDLSFFFFPSWNW